MKNSKIKGFTLIELIVVIAIIGILAAILVPSMVAYLKTSRISTANANAKLVHTSMASALTDAAVAGTILSENTGKTLAGTGDWVTIAAGTGKCSNTKILTEKYLGTNFKGKGYADINEDQYSINFALWVEDPGTTVTQLQLSSTYQSNNDIIIGCYPLLPETDE